MKRLFQILAAMFRIFDIERRGLSGMSFTSYIDPVNCCAICGSPVLSSVKKFRFTTIAGSTYCFAGFCRRHKKYEITTSGGDFVITDDAGRSLPPKIVFFTNETNLFLYEMWVR